jgi:NAD(P)-dependent dehydrogenase (short-subunit alcohol dehydrogenase family)
MPSDVLDGFRLTGRTALVTGAALLLCSEAGAYINGAKLYVDGGRSIG